MDILSQRLRNQKLVRSDLRDPVEIVAWLGAVQSQDYPGAKWALKLRGMAHRASPTRTSIAPSTRAPSCARTSCGRRGTSLRPADIRWMLSLTGPRVMAGNRHYCRKNGLDDKTLARSRRVLERSLGGGKHMTRTALAAVLSARAFLAMASGSPT